MNSTLLDRLGFKPFFANQFALLEGDLYPARIAARQRSGVVILGEQGERHLAVGLLAQVGETAGDPA